MRRNSQARSQAVAIPHESGSPDGLHEQVWQRLTAIVTAARNGETDEFLRLWEALQAQIAEPKSRRWAVVYIHYILEYRVHQILGRRPALEDLREIATRYNADYSRTIDAGKVSLLDTLCTVFELANPSGQWITGPEFGAAGSAAIGVMLEDPAQQLPAIRPHLAAWCSRYAGTLSAWTD